VNKKRLSKDAIFAGLRYSCRM